MKKFIMRTCIAAGMVAISASTLTAQNPLEQARSLVKQQDYTAAVAPIRKAIAQNPKDTSALVLGGDIYMELEKVDSALVLYKQAEDVSDATYILRKLSHAYALNKKYTEALKTADEAIKDDKKDPLNYLALAEVYIQMDSLPRADNEIRKALKINDNLPEGYVALGDLYYAQRVFEIAKENYEKALELNPNLLQSRIKLAVAYFRLGNEEFDIDKDKANVYYNQSLKLWDDITNRDPKNATAFFEKGKIQFLGKKYGEAATTLARYVELRPDGSAGRWMLAQCYHKGRKFDDAIPHLEYAVANIDSVKTTAQPMLAESYYFAKKFPKAKEMYAMLQQQGVALSFVDYRNYGLAAINSGDTTTAIPAFKASIMAKPDDQGSCRLALMVANLMRVKQQYDDAILLYRTRLQNCSDSLDMQVRAFIGLAYFSANKIDSAIIELQAAVALDSNNLFVRAQLANSYKEANMEKEAKTEFLRIVSYAASDTAKKYKQYIEQAYTGLANISVKGQDFSDLNKLARDWTTYDASSVGGNLYLGISYQGLMSTTTDAGQQNTYKGQACQSYNKVLQLDPSNEYAKKIKKDLGC